MKTSPSKQSHCQQSWYRFMIFSLFILLTGFYSNNIKAQTFDFNDGTTQGWALDQMYVTSSQVKFTPVNGYSLLNSYNELMASTGSLFIGRSDQNDIYLESPDLSSNSAWQGITGYSVDVKRSLYSPCWGDFPNIFFIQLQIKVIDTQDGNKEKLFLEYDGSDFVFHEILTTNQLYQFTWKPSWLNDPRYKVKSIRLRITGPGDVMSECWYRGGWSIDNVAATTGTSSAIVINEPNGGETWQTGSQQIISWSSQNIPDNDVTIEYSTDNGQTYTFIDYHTNNASTESYTWDVPNTPSTNCLIKISLYMEGVLVSDVSNATFTISPGSISDNTWGNTEVYPGTSTMANRRAIPVTASEDGTIESLSIYHNGGGGGLMMGVYSDASGSPSSRIGVTSSATASSAAGWQKVNLSSPVSVSAGQTIWLAWVFESNPGIRYTSGTPARAESSATWSGGIPTTFGASSLANYKYSVYCTYTLGGTSSGTLGNTDIYSGVSTKANRRAIPVTASESGSIESLSIYHNGGSGGLMMGVYSDASGSPSSRLGVTSSATASSAAGWQTVNLSSPVSVSAGQTVWLAWVFESNPGIRYTSGIPARAQSSATWSGGIPTTFGASSLANYKYSIYCTYNTAGAKAVNNDLMANIIDEQKNEKDQFLVFPNPTNGMVTVSWTQNYERGLILTIMNSIGQTMEVLNIEPNWGEVELNLGDYKVGMYFIMISDPGEDNIMHRGKVIKSR